MLHHGLSVFFALLTIPLACLATRTHLAPRWDDMRVKHSWKSVPENWESLGLPPNDTTLNLYVALRSRRPNAMIAALHEVSTPGHPKNVISPLLRVCTYSHVLGYRYGAHLSKAQVAELVAPHQHTSELVGSWLKHYGILPSSVSVTHGGNWLTITDVSVSKANELLGASYQLYRHAETNETIVRTVGYSLPVALHGHVQTVAPTTFFASPRMLGPTPRKRSRSARAGLVKTASSVPEPVTALSGRDDNDEVTPSVLRRMYSSALFVPAVRSGNVLAIGGYAQQYPSEVDLRLFMNEFRRNALDATFDFVPVNGGENEPNNPSLHANIDVQYAAAMAYPIHTIYYYTDTGPLGIEDPYLTWLAYVRRLPLVSLPKTVSMSYSSFEKNVPRDYADVVCDQFGQLGGVGVTVLFTSGDFGVGPENCEVNGNIEFMPTFPASCPWLTSVGGTTRSSLSTDEEVAAVFSGGGFSNYFVRPRYQFDDMFTYFGELREEHRGRYNASSRGFPDIAALATNIVAYVDGGSLLEDSTSCATPIVAGLISLLNEVRLTWPGGRGDRSLGWLNPWLYGMGRAGLKDITSGSNPGCGTTGFTAVRGWDPVTGLGSLNFQRLLDVLPPRNYTPIPG